MQKCTFFSVLTVSVYVKPANIVHSAISLHLYYYQHKSINTYNQLIFQAIKCFGFYLFSFACLLLLSSIAMRSSYFKKQLLFSYRDYLTNGQGFPKGTLIQDYKIIKQIGKGAFGKIYLAQNSNRDSFALKLMDLQKIHKQPNPKVKQIRWRLIKNQPMLMQQCNSPNVLKCYDIFENESLKLLVLEYCNGSTLQSYIDRKGKIPEGDAVRILRQIINGIAQLHNHNIIHRDLKADNIMQHEGQYKIIDLGFSKKLDIQNEQQEVTGTTLGTVTTMAPQVLAKASYGLKADIWSIGIIFFQMVFGTYLYDTVTVRQRLQEIEMKNYFSPDKQLTLSGVTVSKEANNFLFRALTVSTEKRMGWRELLDHPLIKPKQEQSIGSQFLVRYQLKEPKADDSILLVEERDSKYSKAYERQQERPQEKSNLSYENERSIQQLIAMKNEQQTLPLSGKQAETKDIQMLVQMFPDKKPKQQQKKFKIDTNFSLQDNAAKQKIQYDQQGNNQEDSRLLHEQKYVAKESSHPKPQSQIPMSRWQSKPNQIPNFYEHNRLQNQKKHGSHIQDSPDYIWVKQSHLQCLKTQLIYYNIIVPIEREELLNLEDRLNVQFMFLLATRCFYNMSNIKFRIQSDNKEVSLIVKNLYQQVRELYKKVYEKFLLYSQRLTRSQNSFGQMFFDFFKKRFNTKDEEQKGRFTSGIQSSHSLGDYSKQDQINFTYNNYIRDILNKLLSFPSVQKASICLNHYVEIMTVTIDQLSNNTFKEYVRMVTGVPDFD